MEPDKLVQHLGGYGRWQLSITTLHGLVWAALAVEFSVGPYMIDTPPYHCKVPDNSTFNDTIPTWWENGELKYEKCTEYVNRSISNETQPCSHGYWFDPEAGYDSTITTDFELVCGTEIYIEVMMMVRTIIFGTLGIIVNVLSDRYGRKTIYMVGIISKPILLLIRSFMPNFYLETTISTLVGYCTLLYMNNAFVLVMEMTSAKKRTGLATSMEVFYAFGLIAAVPLAYFCRNWRTLNIVIAVPQFVFYIAFLAPESIAWLVGKGRFTQIEKIVRQAAWYNRIEVPEEAIDMIREHKNKSNQLQEIADEKRQLKETVEDEGEQSEKKKEDPTTSDEAQEREQVVKPPTVLDLVRTPRIRMFTLVQLFIWSTNALVYVALTLTMTYMPGNRYMNLLFYALAELAAAFFHTVLLIKFGRRIPMFAFHLVAGLGLMLTTIEVFKDSLHFNWVPMVVAFNVLGKLGISASFMTIYLYTGELYPTQIRSLANGAIQAFTTIAHILSPYTRVLERHKPGLLRGLCGILCVAAAFLGLLLPETHNRPLPETIAEVEAMPRTIKKRTPSEDSNANIENRGALVSDL